MNEDIIIRFLNKKCNSEDIAAIDNWISISGENARWLFEMEQVWSLKDEIKYAERKEIGKAWKAFLERTGQAGKKQTGTWLGWKYVAAVAVILLLSIPVYKLAFSEDAEYCVDSGINVNEVHVPRGQSITLKLSDGTKVWLNADSRFIYPSGFSGKNRIVKIIGEGFFEVQHNKKSPFIVKSGSVTTTVLGTKFNVKAYDEQISVTLLEGIVEVSKEGEGGHKIKLDQPNLQVDVSEDGLIKRGYTDAYALSLWTSGELYFADEPLKNIVTTLERKFNVTITIQDESLESLVFNSRIQKDATLIDVLNILKKTRKLDYKITDNQVILFR